MQNVRAEKKPPHCINLALEIVYVHLTTPRVPTHAGVYAVFRVWCATVNGKSKWNNLSRSGSKTIGYTFQGARVPCANTV